MKLTKILALASVGLFTLTGCNFAKHYEPEAYYLNFNWDQSKDFHILHLTDFHITQLSDREKEFNFIRQTVDQAKEEMGYIDLIIITGDMFTFSTQTIAKETFAFLDTLKIPWAPTWGNHDEQSYYSIDWLTGYLNDLNTKREASHNESYCVFKDLQDDDIFGNSNYVINLENGSNRITQLFVFDSNRYNYGEYFGYDYLHYDQVEWYQRIVYENASVDEATKEFKFLPSYAFFHIPFPEFEEAYQNAVNKNKEGCAFITDLTTGKARDRHDSPTSTGDPKKNAHMFHKMRNLNTRGVFVGHNHTSDYCVKVPAGAKFQDSNKGVNDISLCFGIKATNTVYCETDRLGGQVISIDKDDLTKFTIQMFCHDYANEEVK